MEYYTQEIIDSMSSEQLDRLTNGTTSLVETLSEIKDEGIGVHGGRTSRYDPITLKKSDDLNILEMAFYNFMETFASSGGMDALMEYLNYQSLSVQVQSTMAVLTAKLEAGVIDQEEYNAELEKLPNSFMKEEESEEEEEENG